MVSESSPRSLTRDSPPTEVSGTTSIQEALFPSPPMVSDPIPEREGGDLSIQSEPSSESSNSLHVPPADTPSAPSISETASNLLPETQVGVWEVLQITGFFRQETLAEVIFLMTWLKCFWPHFWGYFPVRRLSLKGKLGLTHMLYVW
jgi:hypothetical protein